MGSPLTGGTSARGEKGLSVAMVSKGVAGSFRLLKCFFLCLGEDQVEEDWESEQDRGLVLSSGKVRRW